MADGSAPADAGNTTDDSQVDEAETLFPKLIGSSSYCSIHNATCMLEYLSEISSEYSGESPPGDDDSDNFLYGGWLLSSAITSLLRHGLRQLKDEYREAAVRRQLDPGVQS